MVRTCLCDFGPDSDSSWIKGIYKSPTEIYHKFSYNVQTLQIVSQDDKFSDDLGLLTLSTYDEYLKYKNVSLYNGSLFDQKYKKYKITSSAIVYMYYMYCRKHRRPFNLSVDKYLFQEKLIKIKDTSMAFELILDLRENVVYADEELNCVDLLNKKD